ncbi:nucleoside triphosphate pyrophosphohydrolase [Acetobacter sp. AN02]|uniref:nucleoside triphosphate pyrophosphohydrolase n=1 Tax=Acetobacter sp. AN02 TaxID=2894186 RepID=UPI00243462D9|nr:nucleoside triphosphate pyrophosphohydrolase [Acetobacter sp. AN02]
MSGIARLLEIMTRLRDPENGCPWDVAQTPLTVAPYAIEEAYEVLDAIQKGDTDATEDELGDLLLQVVFQSQIAAESGDFTFDSVANRIADKMIRRHPHVFAQGDAARHADTWEAGKAAERQARAEHGTLAGIPQALPALMRARKLAARAARVGFDWPDVTGVVAKVREETEEVEAEILSGDRTALRDEIGDLLFAVASLARRLDIDPEEALRGANAKFQRRFEAVEALLARDGETVDGQDVDRLDALWQQVKRGA